jgi:hypothetical protein
VKNLKPFQKIILIHIGIAFLIAIYYTLTQGTEGAGDFALAFGIICLLSGIADLFISLILFFASSREWSKGFLLSGGILLLLSGLSCGLGAGMY